MGNAVCLTIDTEEVVRQAIQLRAAKEGVSVADVINDILRKALAGEIQEVAGVPPLADVIQNVMNGQAKTMN